MVRSGSSIFVTVRGDDVGRALVDGLAESIGRVATATVDGAVEAVVGAPDDPPPAGAQPAIRTARTRIRSRRLSLVTSTR
jgi:hypothetical protein